MFKGVPFAQPPVGDLRWKEPQPPKPIRNVRSTTGRGNGLSKCRCNVISYACE